MSTVIDTNRVITTPCGFRLVVPIMNVHRGEVQTPKGVHFGVIWREAERLLNLGYPVRLPRGRVVFQFYGRHITAAMVRALGRLKQYHDRHPSEEYAHLKDFGGPRHGDWARLRHWGLIEHKQRVPGEKAATWRGWWKLTGLGHCWLRGIEKVPRTAAVFDGVMVGFMNATDTIGPADADPEFSLDQVLGVA